MARWVKSHNQMRIFKQTATPAVVDGLAVGDIWIDTTSGATLKVCTAVGPVVFGSVGSSDTNGNASADMFLAGYTSTATAATTTTLTVTDTQNQIFTGVTTHIVKMPAVSTLALGTSFTIVNLSSGAVTVNSSGNNAIQIMQANSTLTLLSNATSGTGASVWTVVNYVPAASGQTGTGSLVRATSPTLVTPALGTIASGDLSAGTGSLVNLTTITSSADSTIQGVRVGIGNGAVTGNTVFGNGAVNATATGAENCAFGYQALKALTSGVDNCALGYQAAQTLTTASRAMAVGTLALQASNALDCCAVGHESQYRNTSGSSNMALGSYSMFSNQTGTDNVAIGDHALYGDGTSSYGSNVGVGSYSLYGTSTGTGNTALGYESGYSGATGAVATTTGTYNTFVGLKAAANSASSVGVLSLGAHAVAEKATGATSGDDGPGLAIGSAAYPVGFRGDATIYPTAGAGGGVAIPLASGFLRVKINGTYYKMALIPDA